MTKQKLYVSRTLENGYWIIRITGLSSGLEIIANDAYNITVKCKFDAQRFEPVINPKS